MTDAKISTIDQTTSLFEQGFDQGKRRFLSSAGTATLSAATVLTLAGCAGHAKTEPSALDGDIRVLNTAIAAELEAIAAYQVGAESGLLSPGVLKVAVQFQGHHKEHAELLSSTVEKLGGKSAVAKGSYQFPLHRLKSEGDVLGFAAGLERGAVSAYAGAIPLFADRSLAGAAASILADEAMHWAVLRNALSLDPVPGAFFS